MKTKNIHIFQHVSFQTAGLIENWARSRGYYIGLTRFFEHYQLPEIEEIDWLIVLGGPMSTYDDSIFDWMQLEKRFIEKAIEKEKVVMGIGFGSETLAQLLGGRVYRGIEKEFGWFTVHLHEPLHPFFEGFSKNICPFHAHGETFELPNRIPNLAYSAAYPNQAFVYESRVVGLQFHLEAELAWLQRFLATDKNYRKTGRYVQDPKTILAQNELMTQNRENLFKLFDNICSTLER